MGVKKERRLCVDENRMVLAERETPNHVLHLLLTVVSLGLWVPVWLVVTLFAPRTFHCPQCGGRCRQLGWRESAPKQVP